MKMVGISLPGSNAEHLKRTLGALMLLAWCVMVYGIIMTAWSCFPDAAGAAPSAAHPVALRPLALVDPRAKCNDGSPYVFYMQPAVDLRKQDVWLVHLEGGGWCWDRASCLLRKRDRPSLTSSRKAPSELNGSRWQKGIFANDQPNWEWAGANKVYLPYCSSDAWMGSRAAGPETFGWGFHGQDILRAVVAQFTQGGRWSSVSRVLLSGCSAGARGLMANLGWIAEALPAGLQLMALLDSPLWMQLPSARGRMPLSEQTAAVLGLANATVLLSPECSALPGWPQGQWRCLFGEYRLPLLRTPYVLNAALYDAFQVMGYTGRWPNFTDSRHSDWTNEEAVWADGLCRQTLDTLRSLPGPGSPGPCTLFGGGCVTHCLTDGRRFWQQKVHGVSLGEAVHRSWIAGGKQIQRFLDTCPGGRHREAC
mmetsp:Transcript_81121/g.143012  ORF Transcript_81121/g.143012 Transcript_81121/m.143012 type:complete len:423 (-) Transcript_81121:159-1427(-)